MCSFEKIISWITYLRYYWRFKKLDSILSAEFGYKFNKTKRVTLKYLAARETYADALDYAYHSVYGLWGCDSLTKQEKKIIERLNMGKTRISTLESRAKKLIKSERAGFNDKEFLFHKADVFINFELYKDDEIKKILEIHDKLLDKILENEEYPSHKRLIRDTDYLYIKLIKTVLSRYGLYSNMTDFLVNQIKGNEFKLRMFLEAIFSSDFIKTENDVFEFLDKYITNTNSFDLVSMYNGDKDKKLSLYNILQRNTGAGYMYTLIAILHDNILSNKLNQVFEDFDNMNIGRLEDNLIEINRLMESQRNFLYKNIMATFIDKILTHNKKILVDIELYSMQNLRELYYILSSLPEKNIDQVFEYLPFSLKQYDNVLVEYAKRGATIVCIDYSSSRADKYMKYLKKKGYIND